MSKSGTILHPKTVIPKPILNEIVCPSVHEELISCKNDSIILIAPSGYGKTTMLAQYARNTNRKVVWLTFREGDVEQDNLMLSIQQAFQSHTQIALEIHSGYSLEDFLNQLIGEIAHLDAGIDLILDHVEKVSHIHGKFLGQLVHFIPKGHRVLMAGYDMSGFPLARMVASGQVKVISQEQLCFSLDQIETLLNLYQSNVKAQDILELTEGWPVGITLHALGYTHQVDVYDLLQDALDKLPEDLTECLIDLSLAEEWSDATVSELQLEFPPLWLRALKKSGLPLTPLGNDVFKPHNSLLAMLRKRLSQQPARAAKLHIRYAKCAAQSEKLSCAMKHAAEANHVGLLEQYAQELFPKLWKQREFDLLLHMTTLHLDQMSGWWKEHRAVALIETGDIKTGREILDHLLESKEVTALGYSALATQAARVGQFGKQLEFASAGLNDSNTDLRIKLSMQKASALISLERPEEGLEITQMMIDEGQQTGNQLQIADALNIHHYGLQMLRRWSERIDILDQASKIYHTENRTINALQIDIERMHTYILQGRFEEVAKFFEGSFEDVEKNQPVFLSLLYHCHALFMMALGNHKQAFDEMSKADKIIIEGNAGVLVPIHNIYLCDLSSKIGDTKKASQYLLKAIEASEDTLFRRRLIPLFEGLKYFDDGNIKEAKVFFKKAIDLSIDQAYYIRSHVMLLAIEYQEGHICKQKITQIAHYLGQLCPVSVCGPDQYRLQPLIQYLSGNYLDHPLNQLILDDYALMEVNQEKEEGFFVDIGETISCFYNGRKLKLPLVKAGELLAWLIWHQDGTLHEILHDLWDGSSESKHHEYFRVLVRKLRAMFKGVVEKDIKPLPYSRSTGRYSLNERLQIKCNLHQILLSAEKGDYSKLLEIRADKLLSHIESEWVFKIRSAIYDKQILVLKTIRDNADLSNIDWEISILKSALRVHSERDEFNIALIDRMLKVNVDEALCAFRVYSDVIRTQFECDPDPQIVDELRGLGLPI